MRSDLALEVKRPYLHVNSKPAFLHSLENKQKKLRQEMPEL